MTGTQPEPASYLSYPHFTPEGQVFVPVLKTVPTSKGSEDVIPVG